MADLVPVLSAEGISKSFLTVRVLDNVGIDLYPGEVHALLGENGAGKSTLIKILTGAYSHDAGTIRLNGETIVPRDTRHAQTLGIGTVYQEVNLLPNMTVAENLYIGRQPMRFGFVDRRRMEADARGVLGRYGLDIDVGAELGRYSVAIQQIVAIARAVDLSDKVLILDEPTASLDAQEIEVLFAVVRGLKARGMAIVFITHFLEQVFDHVDRVTVLRNGSKVGTRPIGELTRRELVQMMLGKALANEVGRGRADSAGGDVLAEYKGYGLRGKAAPFDLTIRKGEVVGVAGLLGSGRTETARLVFGVDQPDSGEASVDGRKVTLRSPPDAIGLGFGYCPEDRKTDGIVGDLTVRENIMLALQGKRGWARPLSFREQNEIADKFVKALDIRLASIEQSVKLLSGGNQQKVILARWLATEPRLLILDEPTRGIDVGAHAEIIAMINRLCDEGLALYVISSELDELVAYSSRVVVMRDRQMVAELRGEAISSDSIMAAIAAEPEARA